MDIKVDNNGTKIILTSCYNVHMYIIQPDYLNR